MTIYDIKQQLKEIQSFSNSGDYEAAHRAEDVLYQAVLEYLADQGNALAREALRSQVLAFPRHCA